MGNDCLEHGPLVDRVSLTNGDGPPRAVLMARGDDSLGIRDDWVVQKHVHVVLRCQQRADVPLQDEVRLSGAFDGLGHLWIGCVHEGAHSAANALLPFGQELYVGVDARVEGVSAMVIQDTLTKIDLKGG